MLFTEAYEMDKFRREVINELQSGPRHRKDTAIVLCNIRDG
jgi:hypothetical protein